MHYKGWGVFEASIPTCSSPDLLKKPDPSFPTDPADEIDRGIFVSWRLEQRDKDRVRLINLSITHIFRQAEAEVNIGQPCHAASQDHVAGRRVSGSVQIAAESGESCEEVANRFLSSSLLHWNQVLKKFEFRVGEG